jgi:hypothetical protein
VTSRAARRHTLLIALAVGLAPPVTAQDAAALRVGASPRALLDSAAEPVPAPGDTTSRVRNALDRMPLWSAPLASAIVPGLGQARLHKDRFVAFMAAEAFLVLQYAKSSNEGRDNAQNFRAISRDIARRGFPGTHPDTSAWKYYETMEKYLESGRFTLPTNGPTVPETDVSTYNGSQWVEARLLFGVPLDDPDAVQNPNYARALARYESTAIRQAYGWSWRNAQLEQDLYRRSIGRSNDAYRRATGDLLAIIANHVIGAVDAFASVRLIQAAGGEMRMSASIPVR